MDLEDYSIISGMGIYAVLGTLLVSLVIITPDPVIILLASLWCLSVLCVWLHISVDEIKSFFRNIKYKRLLFWKKKEPYSYADTYSRYGVPQEHIHSWKEQINNIR